MQFNLFYSFFLILHKYQVIFSDIFPLFLAQNYKTKVLTVQKKSSFRMSGLALSTWLLEDSNGSQHNKKYPSW